MNLKLVLLVGILVAPALLAVAAAKGEEVQEIDLTAVNGKDYFLGCTKGDGTVGATCGLLGLWQQTNGKPGLQRSASQGAAAYKADLALTP